jgi:hypothetical protein
MMRFATLILGRINDSEGGSRRLAYVVISFMTIVAVGIPGVEIWSGRTLNRGMKFKRASDPLGFWLVTLLHLVFALASVGFIWGTFLIAIWSHDRGRQ